jgi:hypothetical protein
MSEKKDLRILKLYKVEDNKVVRLKKYAQNVEDLWQSMRIGIIVDIVDIQNLSKI